MKSSNFLVPIDFSPLAQLALEFIVSLVEGQPDVTLTLLHVVEPLNIHFLSGQEVPQPFRVSVRTEQAERQLKQLRGVYESRVHLETRVTTGTAAQNICEIAQGESMDAVILCSHGHAGLAHTTMGSVAERVAQEAACPVMVVKVPKDNTGAFVMLRVEPRLEEILVGYDRKGGAELALLAALDITKGRHARITLVHALEPPPPSADGMNRPVDASLIDKAKAWLQHVIEQHPATHVEWRVVVAAGHPWQLLVETAKELGADLVVVGPHDYTGWRHCFLGSTAQRVVRLTPCSVLAVK